MNSFGTVKIVSKSPTFKPGLIVGGNEVILMDNTKNPPAGGLEIPAEIKDYLEGILTDANMTYADEAMHEELINELFVRLDNYITSVLVDKMPPEYLDEFIKMSGEKKSQTELEVYLKDKIPNAQDVLTKAFMDFRDMYLTSVSVARNAPEENAEATTPVSSGSSEDLKGGAN